MPFELPYPVPENILVRHPKLGVCFFTKGERRFVCRSALTGNEVDTRLINVNKGWTLYTPPTGKINMFYLFAVHTSEGLKRIGASAANEDDSKRKIRAKLGLGSDVEMTKMDEFTDAANCSFEEFKASSLKGAGTDTIEAMQQAVDPRTLDENGRPKQGETDPSRPIVPPESETIGTPGGPDKS